MEQQFIIEISEIDKIEIPQAVTDALGTELKSTSMNGVWLLIAGAGDARFEGAPLSLGGAGYILPEAQMSALGISPGDTIRLVFSDVLKTAILQKLDE